MTDAGRDRSNPMDLGEGYPKYASAMIQDCYPDTEFEFVNLGISGNRTEHVSLVFTVDLLKNATSFDMSLKTTNLYSFG